METTFDLPKSMANGFFYVGIGIGTWALAQLVAWGFSLVYRQRTALADARDSWLALAQELASGIRPQSALLVSSNFNQPQPPVAWLGWRSFVVERIEREAADTISIYLQPEDGLSLPAYLPGQFITLAVNIPGEARPLVRCYSLSDRWQPTGYRITVKEAPREVPSSAAPAGAGTKVRVSRYLCRGLKAGATLQLKAPSGQFTLKMQSNRPVVLLGAGIGVTPLVSMLQSIALDQPQRKAVALLQFRNGELAPFRRELKELCKQQTNIQLVQAYSAPLLTDREGTDFDLKRRITPELLRQLLPHNQFEFYLCGPAEFMRTMVEGLEAWGVPAADIHYEAFGPASFKRAVLNPAALPALSAASPAAAALAAGSAKHLVQFQNSGTGMEWNEKFDSLLSLLESCDIPVESGCRAGNCGTCALALHSGKVRYTEQPAASLSPGECLPCVCVPEGPLILRA